MRISQRLRSLVSQSEAARTSNGRELVVVKDAAIAAYMKEHDIRLRRCSWREPRNHNEAAHAAGRAAGDRATFGRPVSGAAGVLRLGGSRLKTRTEYRAGRSPACNFGEGHLGKSIKEEGPLACRPAGPKVRNPIIWIRPIAQFPRRRQLKKSKYFPPELSSGVIRSKTGRRPITLPRLRFLDDAATYEAAAIDFATIER